MHRPESGEPSRALGRAIAMGLGVVAVANLLFFILVMSVQPDADAMAARIRAAFREGELGVADFLWFDSRRGWNQYNDCNVLQMLANEDSSQLGRALAPRVYAVDWHDQCAVLHSVFMGGGNPDSLSVNRYARYWHGYKVAGAIGLSVIGLRDLRRVFSGAVWLAIAVLTLLTSRYGSHVRWTGLTIAGASATVWAVPYFAPGFTHGPGDAVILLALSVIVARQGLTARLDSLIPFAVGFGATVAFFEMLTAQLPVAAGWLMAIVLAAKRDDRGKGDVGPPVAALVAVTAFGLGGAVTVVTKQVIATLMAEPQAPEVFLSHLRSYAGVPESEGAWPGILVPFARLVQQSYMLTYGNTAAGYGLVVLTTFAWIAAGVRGWRRRDTDVGRDVAVLLGASLVPVAWIFLLPNHTEMHATFMVRMLVVPIAIAPLALVWPSLKTRI